MTSFHILDPGGLWHSCNPLHALYCSRADPFRCVTDFARSGFWGNTKSLRPMVTTRAIECNLPELGFAGQHCEEEILDRV